jgi:hypothetical protein
MQDEKISTASCEFQTFNISNPLIFIPGGNGVFFNLPTHTAEEDG